MQAELAAIKLQIAEAVEAEDYDKAQALKTKMAGVELAAIKLQIAEAVEAEEYETAQELKTKMAALQANTRSPNVAAAPVVQYTPPSSTGGGGGGGGSGAAPQADQRWCKKCAVVFSGGTCPQSHANFLYTKKIPTDV